MWGKSLIVAAVGLVLALTSAGAADARTTTIRPGPEAQVRLEQALATARPGDVVRLREGRYVLTRGLELTGSGVTVRGEGPDRTVLDFSGLECCSAGFMLTGSQQVLRDLSILNWSVHGVAGDRLQQASFINLQISSAAPGNLREALSIQGSEILIDRVILRAPAVTCLHVHGSTGAFVQRSRMEGCTFGASVVNSTQVNLSDNQFVRNSIGLQLTDAIERDGPTSSQLWLRRNLFDANNLPRPSPNLLFGLGLLIEGGAGITLTENTFAEHQSAHVLLWAREAVAGLNRRSPLARDIAISRNAFGEAGMSPAQAVANLPRADVIWDGATQYVGEGGRPRSEPVRIVFDGNASLRPEGAVFVNAGLNVVGVPWSEAQPTVGAPPLVALPPVTPWMPGERQARLIRR